MKQKTLIGIDAGSTHLKVGIFDTNGSLLEIRHRRVNVLHSQSDFSEFDVEEIFSDLCTMLNELLSEQKYQPLAIGISSFGEGIVQLNKDGSVLAPMIAWYDMRGQNDILAFANDFDINRLYRKTGQYASGKFTLSKLLWLKKNQPDTLARTTKILFMQDYLAYKLTGSTCTDYSLASRSMLCDIGRRTWSEEIIHAAGLNKDILPEIIGSGCAAGQVSKEAAAVTQLPEGISVILAGHDHASASVAADIQGKPIAVDSLGTSETCVASGELGNIDKLCEQSIAFYPYYKEQYRYLCSIQGCGGSIEWLANLLFEDQVFDKFFAAAESMAGSADECPLFIPYLKGIQEKPGLYGSIKGLKDMHRKEHICYALLEGLCFEYKRRLDQIESAAEIYHSAIRAAGRLSSNSVFMQLKANILGRQIEVLDLSEAVALGAAVLAGMNIGAIDCWTPNITDTYAPTSAHSEVLQRRYHDYLNEVTRLL